MSGEDYCRPELPFVQFFEQILKSLSRVLSHLGRARALARQRPVLHRRALPQAGSESSVGSAHQRSRSRSAEGRCYAVATESRSFRPRRHALQTRCRAETLGAWTRPGWRFWLHLRFGALPAPTRRSLCCSAGSGDCTRAGPRVAPRLTSSRTQIEAVQEVVVCGGGRQYLACLLTLKCVPGSPGTLAEPALRFARSGGSAASTVEEARRCPQFRAALLKGFANCNKLVYESSKRTGLQEKPSQLRRYAVLSEQFSMADGTLHPDGRVNRALVLRQFVTVCPRRPRRLWCGAAEAAAAGQVVESMYGAVAQNQQAAVLTPTRPAAPSSFPPPVAPVAPAAPPETILGLQAATPPPDQFAGRAPSSAHASPRAAPGAALPAAATPVRPMEPVRPPPPARAPRRRTACAAARRGRGDREAHSQPGARVRRRTPRRSPTTPRARGALARHGPTGLPGALSLTRRRAPLARPRRRCHAARPQSCTLASRGPRAPRAAPRASAPYCPASVPARPSTHHSPSAHACG